MEESRDFHNSPAPQITSDNPNWDNFNVWAYTPPTIKDSLYQEGKVKGIFNNKCLVN